MTIINQYVNGNTNVTIYSDGTKERRYNDIPVPNHPESIDVKITDYCDLGCLYCHESSTNRGMHADLDKLLSVLEELPKGVELAIGGGNPLSHPELITFLSKLKSKGIISNITINQGHIQQYYSLIEFLIKEDLIKGIGISITSNNFKYIEKLHSLTNNIVYHIIAGINEASILDRLISIGNCKALILGYKQFGFGIEFYSKEVENCKAKWYRSLSKYLGKCILSFDNLAIEQLNVKRLFTSAGWNKFYMGDDFTFTQYIDAVKQQYAPTSRSNNRISFNECSLIEYFQKNRLLSVAS